MTLSLDKITAINHTIATAVYEYSFHENIGNAMDASVVGWINSCIVYAVII